MNFPANPTLDQTYTYGTRTWKWDGTTWNLQRGATALATVATTGSFTDLVNKPTTIAGYGITDATAAIPKITSIVVTNSSYTALDDTAVSTAGGYIKIIGTGFTTGSQVLINTTSASSVSFVNSTELRAQLPATAAGTYVIYVVATDGSVAIRVNGITFSATPTWTTASTLPESLANNAINIQFAATSNSNITYSLASGSTLPSGLALSSGGVLSGTVTGITVPTTYNFTVNAIDQELQDSPRAFSISISVVVQIARSLRFNSVDSTYLNRTPGSAGNCKTWTWSGWVKRTGPATPSNAVIPLFGTTNAANDSGFFVIGVLDSVISIQAWNTVFRRTTTVYRDYSAWYHIVVAFDTTQATAANRLKLYVNGLEQTSFSFSADPTQNTDYPINNNIAHSIFTDGFGSYLSGYLTEVNFVDGQALTPTSFGETDPDTGVWRPKYYAGTYGTNGFYLNFSDNSATTAATLGKDYSGNGNNWTPNNFSVAAGVGNDSLVDSPTSYGADTGLGGEVRGNYCILNPLDMSSKYTLTNGNLLATKTVSGGAGSVRATIGISSGKWYWETTQVATVGINYEGVGVCSISEDVINNWVGQTSSGWAWWNGGSKYNGSQSSYGPAFSTGDIIGIALDMDAGTLSFYKNGTSQGQAFSGITGIIFPTVSCFGTAGGAFEFNFGQRPFAYTAPSGFKALCSQNLPTPAIGATSSTQANRYMDVVLRNGLSNASITSLNFRPDFLWNKSRNVYGDNYVFDSVRGIANTLRTNLTAAETSPSTWYTSFNSNGYSIGSGDWGAGVSLVDWVWNAGGTTVTNTTGSLTSQVRANTTAGFSIVTYTEQSSGAATIGHGLGVAPAMIIVKERNDSVGSWIVYHQSLGNTHFLALNEVSAATALWTIWNSTSPSSTVFTLGSSWASSKNSIVYCWAEVPGYSKFDSYVGNGSTDGAFIYTGFRPRFVMVKQTNAVGNWIIWDTARSTYNQMQDYLLPNSSQTESNNVLVSIDALSNGFKCRTTDNDINGSGDTYIFAAFAETPFKYARAR